MKKPSIQDLLRGYLLVLGVACLALNRWVSVKRDVTIPRAVILSVWKDGQRVQRQVVAPELANERRNQLGAQGALVATEELLDEGPVLGKSELLLGASIVPSRDGLKVNYHGRTTYLTPDDLLQMRGYDNEFEILGFPFQLGAKRDVVLSAAASELGVSPEQLLAEAQFRRIAIRRATLRDEDKAEPDIPTLRKAVTAAAQYLARQVNPDGSYKYEIDAITGKEVAGYSWPRHAGATWFIAKVAAYMHDEQLASKASLAMNRINAFATLHCGSRRCIGEGTRADLGSSALTLLALCEMHAAHPSEGLLPSIGELAEFIRSQQRPDGEFAHTYDCEQSIPIDEQFPYYTGEATLALSRAHLITQDPRDLHAAVLALKYLVTRPPLFVTWRYFWAAEHWTCQAVTDLWQRAPSREGLEFCLAWQRYNRGATSRDPEYAGAAGRYLFRSIPLTGAASSTEAAVATLALARLTTIPASEVADLEQGIRLSLTLLLRRQLLPGPTYLMKNPAAVRGAVPSSTTDLTIRIDYPQHAGSAWLGYLKWLEVEASAQH